MKNYRTIIRRMLGETGKYKLPEDTMRAQLCRQLDATAINEVQFQQDLKWLLDRAWIDYTVEAESETKRWFLTEEGRKQ